MTDPNSIPPGRPICPSCERTVHKYSEMHAGAGIFCSYNCLLYANRITAETIEEMPERGDIDTPHGCLCEPCPVDLFDIFLGVPKHWEAKCFEGTQCGWHKEVWCRMDGVRGIVHISVSSDDMLYLINEYMNRGEVMEDFCDTWAKPDWTKKRRLITKFI